MRTRIVLTAGVVAPVAVAVVFAMMTQAKGCVQPPPPGVANVLTHHNDNQRSGLNLKETILTPTALKSGRFHKLFSYVVDGQIYAQPLYVHGLDIGGTKRNVVFIATMHNSVYAFDADHPAQASTPLWQVNIGEPFPRIHKAWWDPGPDCTDITPLVGITSTPVIDLDRGVIYVAAKTRKVHACAWDDTEWEYGIHALDLRTGADAIPSVSVCGAAPAGGNKWIPFSPYKQLNRPGLLLDHGLLYLAFGSHCDFDPYWGWVWAYDAATLRPVGYPYVTTPGGSEGSIWQAGQGLTTDTDGNLYFMTSNGEENTTASPPSLGESFVKLRFTRIPTSQHPGIGFSVADYYHPGNIPGDQDLGSSGPLLIPGTNLLTGGGKEGKLYLLNANQMTPALQVFQATGDPGNHHIHAAPVVFDSPAGAMLYLCPEYENLRVYRLDKVNASIDPNPVFTSEMHCSPRMPGGFVSVSAAGNLNGVVWVNNIAKELPGDTENGAWADGGLDALDALTLERLWSSANDPTDDVGFYAKFSVPTIADGKVFVDSWGAQHDGGQVHVYGLRCDSACPAEQQCVNGTCERCSPQQIANTCGNRCTGSDGCGGMCRCRPGYHCSVDDGSPEIVSGLPSRPAGAPQMRPPPPPKICVCDATTAQRNCAGKCNVSDGCGGVCSCTDELACNPQTSTCCDWQAACRSAGSCATVCGGIQCPCAAGKCTDGKCCASRCNEQSRCGAEDGCGGRCSGVCPAKTVCVEDNGAYYCDPIVKVCSIKPWLCSRNLEETKGTLEKPPAVIEHPDVEYLLSTCRTNPKACALDKTHHHGHM